MQYQLNPFQAAGLSLTNRQSLSRILNISLLTVLPMLSVACEHHIAKTAVTGTLIGKWLLFWAVGIRLIAAGTIQITTSMPANVGLLSNREDSNTVRKATGIANIVLAGMSFLCVANDGWSQLAAITVGVYVGLAGMQHDFKTPADTNAWINMVYDFVVFAVVAICLVF
jgi:hypothetical protein